MGGKQYFIFCTGLQDYDLYVLFLCISYCSDAYQKEPRLIKQTLFYRSILKYTVFLKTFLFHFANNLENLLKIILPNKLFQGLQVS